MSSVHRVAAEYLKQATLQHAVSNGHLSVWGPYAEISLVYPKLKTMGFKFDGQSKSWFIAESALTPAKKQKVLDLIGANVSPAQQMTSTLLDKPALQALWSKYMPKFHAGFPFVMSSGYHFEISGDIQRAQQLLEPFGKINASLFQAVLKAEQVADFEHALLKLHTLGEGILQERDALKQKKEHLLTKVPKQVWGDVSLSIYAGNAVLLGNTFPIKSLIQRNFPKATYNSPLKMWSIPVLETSMQAYANFADDMNVYLKTIAPVVPQPYQVKYYPNKKVGYCSVCGHLVAVGAGLMWSEFDDNEDKTVWKVKHKDAQECKANIAESKLKQALSHNKEKAQHLLREYVKKHGTFPKVAHPQGTEHTFTLVGHSAFETLYVQSTEFWYVRYNGADGDSWDANNVNNHSMAWLVPLTDEAKRLINGALGKVVIAP